MRLLLVRHATADPWEEAEEDFSRQLIKKGRVQSERVGTFLRQRGLLPEVILSSPYPRSLQTAEIIAEILGKKEQLLQKDFLACGMTPDRVFQELSHLKVECILLVGHEPDFSQLIAEATSNSSLRVKVKKTSLAIIDFWGIPEHGAGILQALVPCALMG